AVSIVPNPLGGLDVVGSHTYGANVVGAIPSVVVMDAGFTSVVASSPVLLHFTDANPNATNVAFTATVNWGDGSSDRIPANNILFVLADPSGGFDLVGAHTYTQAFRQGTLSVQVTDDGGASVSASNSRFGVDAPLVAGTLSVPDVTTEGQ